MSWRDRLKERVVTPLTRRWRGAIDDALASDPFQYDADYMTRILPQMARWSRYFNAEVRGIENIPAEGPLLLIGNHSGGMVTPDTAALYVHWYERFGVERPLMGMGFDAAFTVPGLGSVMRRIGQLPASRATAREALTRGAGLLVYPGGSREVFRPYSERNQIQLGQRTGFIRLAMEAGVPVVPVVGHGGHETTVVLARGGAVAEAVGLKERLRIDVLPVLLQFPWGLSTPALPGVPLPAKITLQVLEPEHLDPDGSVEEAYERIATRMQACLDGLANAHPNPLREGVEQHLRRLWP